MRDKAPRLFGVAGLIAWICLSSTLPLQAQELETVSVSGVPLTREELERVYRNDLDLTEALVLEIIGSVPRASRPLHPARFYAETLESLKLAARQFVTERVQRGQNTRLDFNLRSPDLSVPGRPLQHVLLRPAARYRDLSRARGQSDVLPPTESPPPDIPLKNFLQLPRDLERGEEAMRKGKWEDAAAKYSRLIQLYPHLLESYLQLGLAWWKKGERSTAWSTWKKALAVDPQDLTAYLLLAASLAEAGESDQAEHYLNQVRELQPETVLDPSSLMICLTPDADALRKVCWERYQSELNVDVYVKTVLDLLSLPRRELVVPLLGPVFERGHALIQMKAVDLLSEDNRPEAYELLRKAVGSQFLPVRLRAARVLLPRENDLGYLRRLLGDSSLQVQALAAQALAGRKDQDSVPVLEQKLTGTSSPLLRIALAGALSRLGSPMGKPVLDRMSKSPYRHVRAQALEELAKVSDAARSARVRLSPEQELSASAAVIARQSVPLRDQPLPFPTRMARLLKILSQAPDVNEEDRLFVVETLIRRWNYPVNVRRTMWLSAAFTYLVINPGN